MSQVEQLGVEMYGGEVVVSDKLMPGREDVNYLKPPRPGSAMRAFTDAIGLTNKGSYDMGSSAVQKPSSTVYGSEPGWEDVEVGVTTDEGRMTHARGMINDIPGLIASHNDDHCWLIESKLATEIENIQDYIENHRDQLDKWGLGEAAEVALAQINGHNEEKEAAALKWFEDRAKNF